MVAGLLLVRLVVAACGGAIIGLHFERRQQPGGLGTHVLTALGAALYCVVALQVAGNSGDVLRALQGIASGVGFIGGAAVLRHAGEVKGVRTAASIWIAAAIGCAAGVGEWLLALVVAGFAALVNVLTSFIARRRLLRSK